MTIKDDVLAAFQKLDPKDDALWNKDGTPKLEAIRNAAGDQKISRDEMAASIGDQRRAKAEEPAAPPAPPEPDAAAIAAAQAAADAAANAGAGDNRPDTINAQKPQTEGVEDTETPDKNKLIAEAQENINKLDAAGAEASKALAEAAAKVAAIEAEKTKHVAVVESLTPQLSHAEAVKKVQEQSMKTAQANKDRIAAAQTALTAAGLAPTGPASRLDAALAARKRTPEMVQNAAKYHASRQAERLNERMGQV